MNDEDNIFECICQVCDSEYTFDVSEMKQKAKREGAKEELESVLLDVKYISQAFNESDLQAENMINDLQKRIERRLKVLGELK
jgi:NTP pyrophosphatase (non-canonical NTP hydrolase)